MSNKFFLVCKKILLSIFFPFCLLFHCILFLIGKNKQEKIWWNTIIYYIREEYDRDSFTVIGYSLFPLLLLSIAYIILYIHKILFWSPIAFFSILFTIGALLVTIIIALNLRKKTVESGVQFINQLYIHINYLKHLSEGIEKKSILYIITPNINIGTGIDYSFVTIIKNNKNILFRFICKTIEDNILSEYPNGGDLSESNVADQKRKFFTNSNNVKNSMLHYLYNWYHHDLHKLDASVEELRKQHTS